MTEGKIALLADRGLILASGEDAAKLLQGLVTSDIERLSSEKKATHAALLSPQGKILFDFIVMCDSTGFLIDAPKSATADLIRKLTMYRMRAKAGIADVSSDWAVAVFWGQSPDRTELPRAAIAFEDPRLASLGWRVVMPAAAARELVTSATAQDYHSYRIGLGVPEGGKDYSYGEAFPHEVLMDILGGVSFTKGCYVGQEIVARMEHRSTVRRRIVPIVGELPLPSAGTEILAGGIAIGTLGSTAGNRGLAMMRLDRAAEFAAKGVSLTASGIPVEIKFPCWATFNVAQLKTGETA